VRALEPIHTGWGITVVRVMMSIIFIIAGYQKFMVMGIGGVTGFFRQYGIPLPELAAPLVAALELIGGILLLVGFGARWLGLLYFIEFLVAAFVVVLPAMGWNAARLELMLLCGGLMLFLAGPGEPSVDEVLVKRRSEPAPA
jgi:putative oxidoreductase